MARVPRHDDLVQLIRRHKEDIRQLRSRKRCHAESKTFLVPGDITTGMYIPPFFVAVDPDHENPEYKTIYAYRGVMLTGTVTVQWLVNGVQVGADHVITTIANQFEVTIDPDTWTAARLTDGDVIQPSITDSSSATYFAGAVCMLTQAA